MAYTDDATLLQDARNCLTAILKNPAAQVSVTTRNGARTFAFHNISELRALINELEAKVNAAQHGRVGVVAFARPR